MRPGSRSSLRPLTPRTVVFGLLILVIVGLVVTATVVAVSGGQADATGPAVEPPEEGGVAGYVFQDRNGNGVQDDGEIVLPGATVRLYSTGPLALETTTTDESGVFSFPKVEHITPGETTVRLRITPVMEGPATENMPANSLLSQEYTVALGEVAPLPAASFRQCLTIEDCPGVQLPDLLPVLIGDGSDSYPAPTETTIDTEEIPGRVLLRFATSTANIGGLFHIVALEPGAAAATEGQAVQQRVYGDDGVYIHDAGSFVYHATHNHFHVDDFVRYELLSDDKSEVLAESGKVSFCLTDVLVHAEVPREDGDLFLDLPPFDCGLIEQGINSGFADYYGRDLPDQWVDVTDLPAGRYWVRITVDPNEMFVEADRSNNVAEFPVDYTPPAP